MQFHETTLPALARHFLEGIGLGWKQRNKLLANRQARFSRLAEHDDRIVAHIAGLRHVNGFDRQGAFGESNDEIISREIFSLLIRACETSDADGFMACAGLAEAMPHLHGAFLAAMDWVSPVHLHDVMKDWRIDSRLRRLTQLRLLADPRFDELDLTIDPPQTQAELRLLLRAARLRTRPDWVQETFDERIGSLDDDLQQQLCAHYLLFDSRCRKRVLQYIRERIASATAGMEYWTTLLASEPQGLGESLLRNLLELTGKTDRRYLVTLGWLGQSRHMPALIDALDSAEARIAGTAISMITGSIPEEDGWQVTAPENSAGRLPLPDKARFVSWWEENRHRFDSGVRYLFGCKREPRAILELLKETVLAWRPSAAWMLQRMNPACALDTEAPAFRQRRRLVNLESMI